MQFQDVLAGEGVGGLEPERNAVVDHLAVSVKKGAPRDSPCDGGAIEQGPLDAGDPVPGQADNPYAARPRRRGDRNYQVSASCRA